MQRPVRKAIFPVGGLGTRFLPATKAMPKEMLPVVDKPLIQYAVEEAREAGIEEVIFVTGRGKAAIEDHFDVSYELEEVLGSRGRPDQLDSIRTISAEPGRFAYIRQQKPLGLGHAVWCARKLIGEEPFAVLLADDLIMAKESPVAQLLRVHAEFGGNVLAVGDVPPDQTNRYGILDVETDDGRIAQARGVVEKPAPAVAPSTLAVIGRYVLGPEVLKELDAQEQGAGGEIQLTDAIAKTLPAVPLHGLRFEGQRFDCGSKAGFLEANVAFSLERSDLGEEAAEIVRRYSASLAGRS